MKEFYILSLKWSRDNEQNLTWWMPNRSGYTWVLEHAGRYSADEAKRHEGSDTTIAIPCEVVDRLSSRVMLREAARSMLTEVLGSPASLAGSTRDDLDYEGRNECPHCERAYGHPGPSRVHVDKSAAAITKTVEKASSDSTALAIYVVMDRDPVDAIDMIAECQDVRALELLLEMLRQPGGESTDRGLNATFVGPVRRRITKLAPADPQPPVSWPPHTGCDPAQVDSRFDDGGES